jgi:hypothetical protein
LVCTDGYGASQRKLQGTVIEEAAAPAASERASLEEFEAAVDALAEGLDHVPGAGSRSPHPRGDLRAPGLMLWLLDSNILIRLPDWTDALHPLIRQASGRR